MKLETLSVLIYSISVYTQGTDGACIFPFVYKGQKYNACTSADSNYLWCASDVDENFEVTKHMRCLTDIGKFHYQQKQ